AGEGGGRVRTGGGAGGRAFRGKISRTAWADDQLFFAPRPGGGAFGSGLRSAGNRSNTPFIAVTALACSAASLSASVVFPLMSDTFFAAATAAFSLVSTLALKSAGSSLISLRRASAASVYS